MRQAGDEAQRGEGPEVRRQRAGDVADGKQAHEQQEQQTTGRLGGKHRNDRGTDHDPERIGGNHLSGARDIHAIGGGDIGQQAHDGEFAGADAKSACRKGDLDQNHHHGRQPRGSVRLSRAPGGETERHVLSVMEIPGDGRPGARARLMWEKKAAQSADVSKQTMILS